jgi:mannan endo-1,4-beta-mannosidase
VKAGARAGVVTLVVLLVVLLAAAAAEWAAPAKLSWSQDGTEQSWSSLPPGLIPQGKGIPVGVYKTGFPRTAAGIGSFAAATGVHPRLTVYYSGWDEPFWSSFANATRASGAVPLVQIQPDNIPLESITGGRWDKYLRSYAAAVKAYGHPVILSFAHEMNGTWYSWGSGHATPAAFVAAWRHVVTIFRQVGAANVTWLWSVTAVAGSGTKTPWLGQWWPGAQWVGLVGIDGYYYTASDTFTSVFGETLTQLRTFTNAPVVISEVGIGPNSSRETQISGLFAGASANHIGAVIWFDENQDDGIYHQDWQLEGDSAALAAFKAAVDGQPQK